MTMEDEKRVFESLKKLADTYRMETAQLTDMTLKFCMSKNCLGGPGDCFSVEEMNRSRSVADAIPKR